MKALRVIACAGIIALVSGCTAYGALNARPTPTQKVTYQDGQPTVESVKTNKLVMAPAQPLFTDEHDLLFMSVVVQNDSDQPFVFSPQDIRAWYVDHQGQRHRLQVYFYRQLVLDELSDEESSRIIAEFSGLLSGLAFATGSSHSAFGSAHYSASAYNMGQGMVNASRNVNAVQRTAAAHLHGLAGAMLKKQTLAPGQWYGGVIQLDGPDIEKSPHDIHFIVQVGNEIHEVTFRESRWTINCPQRVDADVRARMCRDVTEVRRQHHASDRLNLYHKQGANPPCAIRMCISMPMAATSWPAATFISISPPALVNTGAGSARS